MRCSRNAAWHAKYGVETQTGAELPDGDNKENSSKSEKSVEVGVVCTKPRGRRVTQCWRHARLWEIGDIIDVLETWETAHHGERSVCSSCGERRGRKIRS